MRHDDIYVLCIGTRFINLYTAEDTPAKASSAPLGTGTYHKRLFRGPDEKPSSGSACQKQSARFKNRTERPFDRAPGAPGAPFTAAASAPGQGEREAQTCLNIVALSHAVARVGPGTVCGRGDRVDTVGERSTGQTRGEWGAARCDHSRPGAEGLKRPVLDARTSPQAFPRLLTVPSPADSRDCVNASIRFLTEAQSRAFRRPGLDSAPPAMPRPGIGPP